MKVSDYIANVIAQAGVPCVFGVQGGAAVHLFDSIHALGATPVCYPHHEQAAALAAASSAKKFQSLGCCVVTTGPAASNAMTGLLSAWQDSTPVLYISGQTRKQLTSYGRSVRQVGSQETNILDVVSPWCKYSAFLDDPEKVPQELITAIELATTGRMGPVWLDIPVDVQWSTVNNPTVVEGLDTLPSRQLDSSPAVAKLLAALRCAKKPLFVLGRFPYDKFQLSLFLQWLSKNRIPAAFTWGSATIAKGQCLSVGILGPNGQPAANFSMRSADTVIFLGCHFSVTQSGNSYVPRSESQKFVFIDIDRDELNFLAENGHDGIECHCADANDIITGLVSADPPAPADALVGWWDLNEAISKSLSPATAVTLSSSGANLSPHDVFVKLYGMLSENDTVVIDGGGCTLYSGYQCLPADALFDVYCSTAVSAMGTALPELVGASLSKDSNGRCVCLIGDGSFMFNLQELQTIKTYLPRAIVIVINNQGYLAIRHTQSSFLNSRFFGTSPENGDLEFPDFKKIAEAFDFEFDKITESEHILPVLSAALASEEGHFIIEVVTDPDQKNLFTTDYVKGPDGDYLQGQLDQMRPFHAQDLAKLAHQFGVDPEL